MRIGFLVPSQFAIGSPGNGIAEQARNLATALENRGHIVIRLNPWEHCPLSSLDVLHFFLGGPQLYGIERSRVQNSKTIFVFSPIIDSNQSNLLYRFASQCGSLHPRVFTTPGLFRQQALGSDVIICRSQHEKERVAAGLGLSDHKIAVVLNGINLASPSPSALTEVKSTLNLPDKFVLHVSAYTQERKNVLRLIEAVEKHGYPLVIAGHSEPGSIRDKIEAKVKSNRNIRVLGFVDKETRNALYALCHVFCLPSYHEGTGLAALEAGLLGANLVITKNGGTQDYFSSHASYVDPLSSVEIGEAVKRAWALAKNFHLRDHIAENLTWNHSARALELLYRQQGVPPV